MVNADIDLYCKVRSRGSLPSVAIKWNGHASQGHLCHVNAFPNLDVDLFHNMNHSIFYIIE